MPTLIIEGTDRRLGNGEGLSSPRSQELGQFNFLDQQQSHSKRQWSLCLSNQDGQLGEATYLSYLSGNVYETGCDSSLSTQSLPEMC